jgi:KEOPS complex subunit Cgi121
LLKFIEEFAKYVVTAGFKKAKIKNIEKFFEAVYREKPPEVEIQFFDAKLVATWQHLYFAVLNALTAFKNGQNISKSLAIEVMLYASAQRQIRKAMELVGIKATSSEIAVMVIGEDPKSIESFLSTVSKHLSAERDDTVLEIINGKARKIQEAFEISNLELDTVAEEGDLERALVDLVIERMALLSVQR